MKYNRVHVRSEIKFDVLIQVLDHVIRDRNIMFNLYLQLLGLQTDASLDLKSN